MRPGDDVRVGHDIAVGHDEARSDRAALARAGGDLEGVRPAAAAIARAAGSSGRSTSGAGSGSKPTKTSGNPEALRMPAQLAGDLGDRWQELTGESLDGGGVLGELGEARNGADRHEAAHQPDDRIRRATPTIEPPTRSAAPGRPCRAPAPSSGRRRSDPNYPSATANRRPPSTMSERSDGSRSRSQSANQGRARTATTPPSSAPIDRRTLRESPGPESEDDRDDDERDRDQVEQVHRPDGPTGGRSWPGTAQVIGRPCRRRARPESSPDRPRVAGSTRRS